MSSLNPAILFVIGALLLPLTPANARRYVALLIPLIGMALVLLTPNGSYGAVTIFGLELSTCLLYTSPSPRDLSTSRMPSSA